MKKGRGLLVLIAVVIGAIWIILEIVSREQVYLSSGSDDNRYIAQVVWKRVFPFIQGVDAFLVVKEAKTGRMVLRKELLVNRDCLADVEAEFPGLMWQGSTVNLQHDPNHYKGPVSFQVK